MNRRGTVTVLNGVRYRSGFEAQVAADLIARGISPEYEKVRLLYDIPHTYVVDFAPKTNKGEQLLIEAKGYFPPSDRTKMLAIRAAHPLHDVRLLFQNARQRLRRGSRTTIAAWAQKHGFKWAEGLVPEDWIVGAIREQRA